MRGVVFILSALAACASLGAQTTPFSGPIEAFTFDAPTSSFRAIMGRLGASSLGPAALRGFDYGSVAPRHDYGVGFQNGRGVLVTGLGSGSPATTDFGATLSTPEGVVWSEDGSLAILYSSTANWIQILSGLPTAPAASLPLSLAPLAGSLSTLATDVHGRRIVIGISGTTGGIYEVAGGHDFVPLLATPQPQSLAFSSDAGTLYVLDGANHQLSALNLTDLTSQVWPLSDLQDPVAVRVASDTLQRQILYVAARGDRLLVAYDAASRQLLASVPLDAPPNGIQPLGVNSFLLRSRASAGDPLWSFTNVPQLAVYFVPATPLDLAGGPQ